MICLNCVTKEGKKKKVGVRVGEIMRVEENTAENGCVVFLPDRGGKNSEEKYNVLQCTDSFEEVLMLIENEQKRHLDRLKK